MGKIIEKIYNVHYLIKFEDLFLGASTVFIAACFAYGGLPETGLEKLSLAILFCILGLASINALNQIADVEIDKINKPHRPLPSKKLKRKTVFLISFILSLFAGLITIYLGIGYFIIALAGLAIGLLYNVPPIYAKKNAVFGMLLIGFGYGVLMFLVGWGVHQPFFSIPLWILGFLYLHEVIFSSSKDFSDIKGDSYADVKTIPVIFGKKKGSLICYLLYLIPYVILLILKLNGNITSNVYPLLGLGPIAGIIVFGFCGLYEKKYSYIGYFLSIIVSLVVKISLFFIYIQ